MNYQTGVASVTFRGVGVNHVVKLAKNAGLDGIEWAGDVHVPCGNLKTAKKVQSITKEAGLSIISYGSYFRLGVQRAEDIEYYLQAAQTLGAPIMRIWGGNKSSVMYTKEERCLLISQAKQIAARAEAYGITLGFECHDSTITDDYAFVKQFLDEVGSPYLKTYWQPNRFRDFSYNLEALKALAPDVICVHVQRWAGDTRFFLHEFRDEWEQYTAVLKAAGADYKFILEFLPECSGAWLNSEAETLRALLK